MKYKSKLKYMLWPLMIGFLLAVLVNWMMEGRISAVEERTTKIYRNHTYAKTNQIEILHQLLPENWDGLDLKNRIDILQVVANIQAYELGIPELTIVAMDWQDNMERHGRYNIKERQIELSLEFIRSGDVYKIVECLSHEIHHAYAHRLSEVYEEVRPEYKTLIIFQEAAMYYNDFRDYTGPEEHYALYKNQIIEWHAEQYAREEVKSIYAFIELSDISDK